MKNKLGRWIARQIARLLLNHTRVVIAVALVVTVAAGFVAARLELDTSFSALLPEDTPEVLEIKRLQKRIGGQVELIVALGGDKKIRLEFAHQLVAKLRSKPWIRRADVEFPVEFILDRKLQLMSVKDLEILLHTLEEEIERVKARANPFYVDLEGDEGVKPWDEVDKRSRLAESEGLLKRHFTSADGRYLFVRVLPKGNVTDMGAGARLLANIKSVVGSLDPASRAVPVRYAGGLPLNQEQHHRMISDLQRAAIIALILVLLLFTLYVKRLETPLVVAVPLIAGLCVTFAITRLAIGHLNLVSGMLVTALIGLGIDFSIHLYLRYLEQLPKADSPRDAMRVAIEGTFPSCLTAATTTAAAFFAMTFARFRGFSEYGAIAGLGVLVTLIMTFVTLPPLALAISRRPTGLGRLRLPIPQLTRGVAWVLVLCGVGLTVYTGSLLPGLRYRNDFKKLRGQSPTVEFSDSVDKAFGGSLGPAAVLVEGIGQARRVEKRLAELKADPNSGVKQFLSLAAIVPEPTEKRSRLLTRMEKLLTDLPLQKLKKDDRKHVTDALAQIRMPPWAIEDIPEPYRQQFLTLDQKGTLVLIWPRLEMHEDAEVIAWGDELSRLQRELRGQGIAATILDENRVAARVLRQMKEDAPRVMLYAALAVLLILILDFRCLRCVGFVAGSLGLGILWFLGLTHLFGFEINVFNQAVIPSVLGLGLDNAVHVQHRYLEEGPGSLPLVVSTTGSASFLASATTAIGFGSAVTAYHFGVQSMGWLGIIGFTCTFVSTTILFPAVLRVLERCGLSRTSAAIRHARKH